MGFETLRPQQHVEAQQEYTFNDEYSGGLLELPLVLYEIKYLHTTASFSISTFTSISHIIRYRLTAALCLSLASSFCSDCFCSIICIDIIHPRISGHRYGHGHGRTSDAQLVPRRWLPTYEWEDIPIPHCSKRMRVDGNLHLGKLDTMARIYPVKLCVVGEDHGSREQGLRERVRPAFQNSVCHTLIDHPVLCLAAFTWACLCTKTSHGQVSNER
jgi:hypothetical protein